jgi:hypothetical protein
VHGRWRMARRAETKKPAWAGLFIGTRENA